MKATAETTLPKTKITARKPALTLHKPRKKPTDIDRMRSVARRLLKRLESEIRQTLPNDGEEIAAREQKYHLMFGSRSTYLSALTSLADLLFKLDQAGGAKSVPAEPVSPAADIPMEPADVALVEAFVQRIKKQPEENA